MTLRVQLESISPVKGPKDFVAVGIVIVDSGSSVFDLAIGRNSDVVRVPENGARRMLFKAAQRDPVGLGLDGRVPPPRLKSLEEQGLSNLLLLHATSGRRAWEGELPPVASGVPSKSASFGAIRPLNSRKSQSDLVRVRRLWATCSRVPQRWRHRHRGHALHHDGPPGSTRLITDATGAVVSRHDYFPFGEEIPDNLGGREPVAPGWSA